MFKPSWLTRFALVKAKGFWKRTSHNADQVTMSDLAAARHRAKDLQSILADVIVRRRELQLYVAFRVTNPKRRYINRVSLLWET